MSARARVAVCCVALLASHGRLAFKLQALGPPAGAAWISALFDAPVKDVHVPPSKLDPACFVPPR